MYIHPTADVSPRATVAPGTRIWQLVQIREGARIGGECILGRNVYIDFDVRVGDRCKIQNNASVFHGVTVEDGVFIGPHACLTNDRLPRAITPHGALKTADDWEVGRTVLRYGCAIGASAVVVPGVIVGRFAMVGAGAVVTRSVPDHGLVVGNPARLVGFVCACGGRLSFDGVPVEHVVRQAMDALTGVEPFPGRHAHCTRCGMATLLTLRFEAVPRE